MLLRFVEHTAGLEELETTCDTQNTSIASTIAQHYSRLRTLSLRSFPIFKKSWWKALSVDHLSTIGLSCPKLVEIRLDLNFPMIQYVPSDSSRSSLRTTRTSTPTIMTRSMSRTQTAKRNAIGTDQCQLVDTNGGEAEKKQEIPRW